ncbi:hypothetical protein ABI_05220 [Asticcacaulis biprosthecium C19]|uniref:Uncharacterized protein n=1 Tax=Asticcacaulis biprosthecium C19 TaxID=715226 RepID=F4QK62_9CAUL|nr:hypothetical protein [Asticcacaulis biprosthecium]EGF92089.1 hypothetical protein ABI_05220 [Asticcacaulis biprosthecium C19]
MGADIYCFIETSYDGEYWSSFGSLSPAQDYDLFGLLAGVRGSRQPMIPPRGLPLDLAAEAAVATFFYITETGEGEGETTRKKAAAWVTAGVSQWRDEEQAWVTHYGLRGHSWMTPTEWRRCIELPSTFGGSRDPSYFAVAAAMEEFERRGLKVRVVFWFD